MKKLLRIFFHRVTLTVLFMLVQLVILLAMVLRFNEYFVYFYSICVLLSLVMVVRIVQDNSNPAYKLAWVIPILIVPLFGGLIYLVFGIGGMSKREQQQYARMYARIREELSGTGVLEQIETLSDSAANQSRYIRDYALIPAVRNTDTEYLPLGEIKFERLMEEMEKARHYIFLEYFIIEEGVMWNAILEVLRRKAAEGLDVRVVYDDMGCMFTLPYGYNRKLEEMGIQCCVFNPFRPVLSSRFNNRNHCKIAVIDGHTAFTGGVNLADEYINAYEKHGHWKDTAVLLRGDAAWSFTVLFLASWDNMTGVMEEFGHYRPEQLNSRQEAAGFAQPYFDSPLDGEAVGENIYLNMIYKAERSVYITTPYLIVGYEMITALSTAAKCGVDVRVITPHVADKWYVHAVTRSNYQQLIENGVKIYEYTPGFIHAKSFVVDEELAVVGTVNLDYRSLYLHFECGVWMYRTSCVRQILDDFHATLEKCQEITLEQTKNTPLPVKVARSVLGVFSPLM